MSRKTDLRKAARATAAAAKADQAKRLEGLERSMECSALAKEFWGAPDEVLAADNVVPLRRKSRIILENI